MESVDGDFTLPQVRAYASVQQMPPCDVVIVALKTTHNQLLPELLANLVAPHGVVLVLQNGLGIEPAVAEIVGPERVMGGLCFLCSNKIGPGQIRHVDYGQITLGDYAADAATGQIYQPCGITPRMQQIAADFQQAGIAIETAPDLFLARWKKLVWNIPFNGLSVVLNATTAEIMANPAARDLATSLMQEVLQAAAATLQALSPEPQPDRRISPEFIQTMLDYTQSMKPYRTSMKIDYDEQRPLELEAIFGNPLRLAAQAKLALPQIQMLYQQLQFLDQRQIS